MLVRIAHREDPDQTASGLGLHYLYMHFYRQLVFEFFLTFTVDKIKEENTILGGHPCSQEIPNGLAGRWERTYTDFGHGRLRSGAYVCNDGFRRNRARIMIECIAGQWKTGLERFGIDISKVCLLMSSNEWFSEDQD